MAKLYRSEEVQMTYDKETGVIKVSGFSFEIELSAPKSQMVNVYGGNIGIGKVKLRVNNATTVRDQE